MRTTFRLAVPLALTLALAGFGLRPGDAAPASTATAAPAAAAVAPAAGLNKHMVLALSVDGFTKRVWKEMGRSELPHIHRLMNQGASTRNARTQPEQTTTLPNHVSMVTGRRITASWGGHGVTWNNDRRGKTIHDGAGEWVASVFNMVRQAGGTSAVFAAKSKFSIFDRTWPNAVHKNVIRHGDDRGVVWRATRHLKNQKPTFTFLHLSGPDRAGHRYGFMSPGYKRAIRRADRLIGKVLEARDSRWKLRRQLAIVFTSDHGGVPGTTGHFDSRNAHNYKAPFAIHARYADGRHNIYSLSPSYERPRGDWYSARGSQPIRNGDVANVSLAILGLGPVPKSLYGDDQRLNWR